MNMPLNILVIDDHPIFCNGMKDMLLDIHPDASVFQAASGKEALAILHAQQDIDWIFLDLMLPDQSGIDILQTITEITFSPVIVVSSTAETELIYSALNSGANGFIPKSSDRMTYITSMQQIEEGNQYTPPEISVALQHYSDTILKERQNLSNNISKRQHEVLVLLSKGYSNSQIAHELDLSESTIKSHISTLMETLKANNRTHCVSEAQRLGLL